MKKLIATKYEDQEAFGKAVRFLCTLTDHALNNDTRDNLVKMMETKTQEVLDIMADRLRLSQNVKVPEHVTPEFIADVLITYATKCNENDDVESEQSKPELPDINGQRVTFEQWELADKLHRISLVADRTGLYISDYLLKKKKAAEIKEIASNFEISFAKKATKKDIAKLIEQRANDIVEAFDLITSNDKNDNILKAIERYKAKAAELKENNTTQKHNAEPIETKDINEAATIATERQFAETADFFGLNLNVVNTLLNELQTIRDTFPHFPTLKFIGGEQRYYDINYRGYKARCHLRNNCACVITHEKENKFSLVLNESYFSSNNLQKTLGTWQEAIKKNDRFHPINCYTVKAIIDHEIGHVLDYTITASKDYLIRKLFRQNRNKEEVRTMSENLSKYADTTTREFIAEAWSEYCNNPEPRKLATTVAKRLIAIYHEKFSDENINALNNKKQDNEAKPAAPEAQPEPEEEQEEKITFEELTEQRIKKLCRDLTNHNTPYTYLTKFFITIGKKSQETTIYFALWKKEENKIYVATPVYYDEHAYQPADIIRYSHYFSSFWDTAIIYDIENKTYVKQNNATGSHDYLLAHPTERQFKKAFEKQLPEMLKKIETETGKPVATAEPTSTETPHEEAAKPNQPKPKPAKGSALTVEAVNACESAQEIADILKHGKKAEIIELVTNFGIIPQHVNKIKTKEQLVNYCGQRIIDLREWHKKYDTDKNETTKRNANDTSTTTVTTDKTPVKIVELKNRQLGFIFDEPEQLTLNEIAA